MWKPYVYLLAVDLLALSGLAPAAAQDRTSIAFSDPSRPGTVKVALLNGGITVRGYAGKEVVVEARPHGERRKPAPARADGLRRLEDPSTGLNIEEQDNVVTIGTHMGRTVDVVLQVPWNTALTLKCMNDGEIVVENTRGEVDADNLNGAIHLRNISGAAVVHSLNQNVTAVFDRVDPGKSMSFSSLNGDIDVTLPSDVKARVKMKTNNGEIYTDFDVNLEPASRPSETNPSPNRPRLRRLRFDRGISGTINGGGPEMQFTTFNGKIYIRKKK